MRRNYDDPVYKDWRKKVYSRDKFRCQMPGCTSKYRLQAHHIKKLSSAAILRYDVDNGITLCRSCHERITGHEHAYQSLFSQIVHNNGKESS